VIVDRAVSMLIAEENEHDPRDGGLVAKCLGTGRGQIVTAALSWVLAG
jgi:hypothetical protein